MTTTAQPPGYPETPNLDKMTSVKDKSQPIGEFVEWLTSQGWHLAKFGEVTSEEPCTGENLLGPLCENGVLQPGTSRERACTRCGGTGWESLTREGWTIDNRTIEALLADYFEVDTVAAERERMAVLGWVRDQ